MSTSEPAQNRAVLVCYKWRESSTGRDAAHSAEFTYWADRDEARQAAELIPCDDHCRGYHTAVPVDPEPPEPAERLTAGDEGHTSGHSSVNAADGYGRLFRRLMAGYTTAKRRHSPGTPLSS